MRGGRENNKIQRYEEYRFENNEQETIIFFDMDESEQEQTSKAKKLPKNSNLNKNPREDILFVEKRFVRNDLTPTFLPT